MWDYVKSPNLRLIGVPEGDDQAEKYFSRYYPKNLPQPSKAGQYSNLGNTENTTKTFCKKSNPKAHNHQLHQG